MFCFITSIRSAKVSDDWNRVCELFERTAASVFNQTIGDFRLVAVCHEVPEIKRRFDERLEFIKVSHPVPERNFNSLLTLDKVPKLKVAMRRARDLGATHVMPIDADDLVSRDIAAHALANPSVDGWVAQSGWRHQYGAGWIEQSDEFYFGCGTCNILTDRVFRLSDPIEEERIDRIVIEQGHHQARSSLAKVGCVLQPIPFRAAICIVNNGENTSRTLTWEAKESKGLRGFVGRGLGGARQWSRRRPLTSNIKREFAVAGPLSPSAVLSPAARR